MHFVFTGARGAPCGRAFARPLCLFVDTFFDGVHQHAGNRHIRESGFDFAHAGRAGNVNLGQAIADDVQADEDKAFGFQRGADAAGDFPVAFGQRTRFATTTGSQVAARFTALRDTRQALRHRFAVHNQHAFVAVFDGRQIILRHAVAATQFSQGFGNDTEVRIACFHAED